VKKLLTMSAKRAKQATNPEMQRRRARVARPGPSGAGRPRHDGIDVVDMFSGCGGMSAGFLLANPAGAVFRIAAAVDIDSIANQTFEMNLGVKPSALSVGDLARRPALLRKTLGQTLIQSARPLVLIGCAPCQGFSSHRNGLIVQDDRNSLFVDFARIAAQLRPAAIVVENVPELLSEKFWPFVVRARRILESSGYFVHVNVHNMAEFGVPQERFRAVMLAMPKKFKPLHGFLDRPQYRTVRDAIGSLPRIEAGERHSGDEMHFTAKHRPSTIETIRAVPLDGGNRPEGVGPACLARAKKRSGRAVYEDVYGRLHWDRPAITITAHARNPASGRYVHPEQHRGLSIREAALLQGFPLGYKFSGSLDQRFRQIGNAVPPLFAACLARHVLKELECDEPSEPFDPGITHAVGPSFSRLIPALKAGHRETVTFTNG